MICEMSLKYEIWLKIPEMMRRTFLPALSMINAATPVKTTWIRPTITEARSLSWRTTKHSVYLSNKIKLFSLKINKKCSTFLTWNYNSVLSWWQFSLFIFFCLHVDSDVVFLIGMLLFVQNRYLCNTNSRLNFIVSTDHILLFLFIIKNYNPD